MVDIKWIAIGAIFVIGLLYYGLAFANPGQFIEDNKTVLFLLMLVIIGALIWYFFLNKKPEKFIMDPKLCMSLFLNNTSLGKSMKFTTHTLNFNDSDKCTRYGDNWAIQLPPFTYRQDWEIATVILDGTKTSVSDRDTNLISIMKGSVSDHNLKAYFKEMGQKEPLGEEVTRMILERQKEDLQKEKEESE